MLILKATTETLQLTTSTTAGIDCSVSYTDSTSSASVMSSSELKISTATTTTILGAPAASTNRVIQLISIANIHTSVSNAVSVQKNIAGTIYVESTLYTLQPGEVLMYMDSIGWQYYSSLGVIKADQAIRTNINSQIQYNNGGVLNDQSGASVQWVSQLGSGSLAWTGITSSGDGTKLAAAVNSGFIYTSVDSGVTWTQQTGSGSNTWISIASSYDGTKLIAGIGGGNLRTSTDAGVTWTTQGVTIPGVGYFSSVASSSDGTKLIVAAAKTIYVSTDSGVSWVLQAVTGAPANTSGVAISANGTTLLAVYKPGSIFSSTNAGITWAQESRYGPLNWQSAAVSADGSKLYTTAVNGTVYTASLQQGLTWGAATNTLTANGASPLVELATATSVPTTPASGQLSIGARQFAGKHHPVALGPDGLPFALQGALWNGNTLMTWIPYQNVGIWTGTAGATVGTAIQLAPTLTNVYTAMRRSTFSNVITTANQQVGIRSDLQFIRGPWAPLGGWFFACRFGFDIVKAGDRAFIGMHASTTIVAADPSTTVNMVGFGFDAADTAFTFMHNDNTGTATKETINGQGTLATNNTGYDAYIWCPPSSSNVYYRLDRTDTGATIVDAMVSTDLPISTTTLLAAVHMSNGVNANAGDATLGVNRLYVSTIN